MGTKIARLPGRFGAIPVEVMISQAWRTLPHGTRSALLVLAAQYVGAANGVQNLSRKTCKQFGLDHSRAHKAAIELEKRGLIVCTYRAKYTASRARIPTQWALAWLDITHRNNDLLVRNEKAPERWRTWERTKNHSGRNDRNVAGTVGKPPTDCGTDCGHSATQSDETAVETPNLLRIWGYHFASGGDF